MTPAVSLMTERSNLYTRTNPILVPIKERYSLSKPGSGKTTHHIVLDLAGIDFPYEVGDSIGVYCPNDPHLVTLTLKYLNLSGDEIVTVPRSEEKVTLKRYLSEKGSITDFSKKFLSDIVERQTDPSKKAALESVLADKEVIKSYISSRHVWDLLKDNPEVPFTAQELVDRLMPNLPRFYSIASSQASTPDELHLTVILTQYESHGHLRLGVCTHFLCNLAPLHEAVLPIYLQPHKGFTVPENPQAPIIMIGPGTGIAPFRGFMMERMAKKQPGHNWLFFGEWTREHEYYYQDYWEELVAQKALRVDTAFSRDQDEKIYVQHRMLENSKDFYQWLDQGAIVYVCGDAQYMAKDVDAALHQIVEKEGGMTPDQAKEYVKTLRKEGRYLRDVY